MISGEQIDGQMSSQSPVVWWYREIVGMCVEAGPVLGARNYNMRRLSICGSRTTSFFMVAVPAASEIDLWATLTICIIG
jgi:hypothetical protein